MRTEFWAVLIGGMLAAGSAQALTIDEPVPFHLSPGDHTSIAVGAGTFSSPSQVIVRLTPAGGGASTDVTPETVVANTSVGARLPDSLAAGEYNVVVVIGADTSDTERIWVRQRTFHMIRRSTVHLPEQPSGVNFKDGDFGDVDNDGFLDVFEANSLNGVNEDRVQINQLGRATSADRDCTGVSNFCNRTAQKFPDQTVPGLTANQRTYDADFVDLDLDGDQDLVRIDREGQEPVRVFLNDGTGRLLDRTITVGSRAGILPDLGGITSNTAMLDTGDVDGDSRPDILTCAWNSSQNLLLLNRLHTSAQNFVLVNPTSCDPNNSSSHALCRIQSRINRGCAFGHFNTDNRLDILAPALTTGGPDTVLINTGNSGGIPQFEIHPDPSGTPGPWVVRADGTTASANSGGKLKVVDLDGDGDDDAVIAAPRDEAKRRILWNDAGTRLVELADARYAPASNAGEGSYEVAISDLDRDGDLDLIFTFEGGRNFLMINKGGRNAQMKFVEVSDVWRGERPGGLTDPLSSTAFSLSVSPGDYDLDGDHDLVTGGFSETRVWKNDLFDQPGEERDWILALDRTGSMVAGRDFFTPAKNVLRAFMAQRRSGDAAGLVTFDYAGTDPGNNNAPDNDAKAQVRFQIGERTPAQIQTEVEGLAIGTCAGFCTAIGWAIKKSNDVAAMAPTSREKVIVLATDGEQNQAPHPDTIIPTLRSNVRLYTIALGSDTDDRMLSALATNGGRFYFAGRSTDYASVQSSWRDVDEDVESHATGKQVLPSFIALEKFPFFIGRADRYERWRAPKELQPPSGLEVVRGPIHRFWVDPSDFQVRFTLSWRTASQTNRMILVDPKGRPHPIASSTDREHRDDRSHVIEVKDPLSGLWLMYELVSGGSGPGKATAISSSELRLSLFPEFPLFYTGEPIRFFATLSIPGAEVIARVVSPTKVEQWINGTQVGDRFEIAIPAISAGGTHYIEVLAIGPPERPFLRRAQSAVHVAVPTDAEPDLRKADLSLDRTSLVAGGSDVALATLRLVKRDGAPLAGAKVSFVPSLGEMTGAVQDLGDGRYTQQLTPGTIAGKGEMRARVDLFRLDNRAEYEVTPGPADPKDSYTGLVVGPLKLCTGLEQGFGVEVYPVDAHGNALTTATVEIEKASGPALTWNGPVQNEGSGRYVRRFAPITTAGVYEFRAKVDGVSLDMIAKLDVFDPDSAEGRAIGCNAPTGGKPSCQHNVFWWVLILILIVLLFIVVKRRSTP